jgi:hypothetical protein
MTTSEQARAWAKAEAENLPAGTPPTNAAEWGILHVLSLMTPSERVEAFARAEAERIYKQRGADCHDRPGPMTAVAIIQGNAQ